VQAFDPRPWPTNGLRHSFASFRRCKSQKKHMFLGLDSWDSRDTCSHEHGHSISSLGPYITEVRMAIWVGRACTHAADSTSEHRER
jgi:hypothetical protein